MRGIYAITNILTDTVYYGQSISMKQRINKHLSELHRNKHRNTYLQNSWNKYGKDAFVFTPIQIIEDKSIDLTLIEKKYKNSAYSLGLKLFNIREPEQCAPLPLETRKKISLALIGNKYALGSKRSEEALEIMSLTHKGIIKSEEWRKNISVSKTGKSRPDLIGNKQSVGRKHTKEELKKMSLAQKGNKNAKRKVNVLS
jgi:group I intron endonuclease